MLCKIQDLSNVYMYAKRKHPGDRIYLKCPIKATLHYILQNLHLTPDPYQMLVNTDCQLKLTAECYIITKALETIKCEKTKQNIPNTIDLQNNKCQRLTCCQ